MGKKSGVANALMSLIKPSPRPVAQAPLVLPEPSDCEDGIIILSENDGVHAPTGRVGEVMYGSVSQLTDEVYAPPAIILDDLPEIEPTMVWTGGKIPKKLSDQILNWMLNWYEKGETTGRLFYNPKKQLWKYEVFPQYEPCGMSIEEVEDDPRVEELTKALRKEGYYCWGSIHHHCDVDAFQSKTDEKDEIRWNGFHVTFGCLQADYADVHARYQHVGGTYDVELDQFFEDTLFQIRKCKLAKYPKAWDERFVEYIPLNKAWDDRFDDYDVNEYIKKGMSKDKTRDIFGRKYPDKEEVVAVADVCLELLDMFPVDQWVGGLQDCLDQAFQEMFRNGRVYTNDEGTFENLLWFLQAPKENAFNLPAWYDLPKDYNHPKKSEVQMLLKLFGIWEDSQIA